MLLENTVSSTTLMFLWATWKEKLLSSVDSLSKLENHREREEDKIYIEFVLEYFGTRLNRCNRSCTVFNSEAVWLKGGKIEVMQQRGTCAHISTQNFSLHAREFLLMELFSVGVQIAHKLKEICLSCTNQHCILAIEGTLILQIYQVSKALEDKLLARFGQITGVTGIENLEERFFEIFFPLKQQYENVGRFISLRENPTSSSILKDIIAKIISKIHNGITLGQIGRLQILLPFLPKDLMTGYGKEIIKHLHHNDCWNNELLWLHMDTFAGNNLQDKRLKLIESFETALYTTFKKRKNQNDYIAPHDFLSLLEKFFFYSSLCEYLSGGLFLSRSFFVDFMFGEQGNSHCSLFLESQYSPPCQRRLESFYRPIHDMICQLLVISKTETFTWMESFRIDSRAYFPEMATRLIIMLCLIGINSIDLHQNAVNLLSTIFQDRHIREILSSKFGGSLHQFLQNYNASRNTFFIHFSSLMRDIHNPLVMIESIKSAELDNNNPDFIVLGPESIKCKEILLRSIFRDEGEIIARNGSDGGMKGIELQIHAKKNMQPSNKNSFQTETNHFSGSVKDEDEKGNALSKSILDSSNIHQQKKDDSLGVGSSSGENNCQFSVLEDIKTPCKVKVGAQSLSWFPHWGTKRWLSCAKGALSSVDKNI